MSFKGLEEVPEGVFVEGGIVRVGKGLERLDESWGKVLMTAPSVLCVVAGSAPLEKRGGARKSLLGLLDLVVEMSSPTPDGAGDLEARVGSMEGVFKGLGDAVEVGGDAGMFNALLVSQLVVPLWNMVVGHFVEVSGTSVGFAKEFVDFSEDGNRFMQEIVGEQGRLSEELRDGMALLLGKGSSGLIQGIRWVREARLKYSSLVSSRLDPLESMGRTLLGVGFPKVGLGVP